MSLSDSLFSSVTGGGNKTALALGTNNHRDHKVHDVAFHFNDVFTKNVFQIGKDFERIVEHLLEWHRHTIVVKFVENTGQSVFH